MPAFLCIRVRNGRLILEAAAEDLLSTKLFTIEHQAGWWEAAIDHLVREATQPGPGNRALLGRLAELLFMEVVRWQLSFVAEGRRGWLAGLNDLQVGRELFDASWAYPPRVGAKRRFPPKLSKMGSRVRDIRA
jgi:hypothetical protein